MNRKKIVDKFNKNCLNYYKNNVLKINNGLKLISINDVTIINKQIKTERDLIKTIYTNFLNLVSLEGDKYTSYYHSNFFELFNDLAIEIVEKYLLIYHEKYSVINRRNVDRFMKGVNVNDELKKLYNYCVDHYLPLSRIFTGTIKILSYNISWEAMLGQSKKEFICRNQVKDNECTNNLNIFLNRFISINKSIDFILLQEASKSEEIYESINAKYPDQYKRVTIKQGEELMTTIYNRRFNLDQEDNLVTGNLRKNNGRPFLALFFDGWLCIINVHHDHNDSNKIERVFEALRKESEKCYQKLSKYQIIFCGDINHNLKDVKLGFGLTGITSDNKINEGKITCCDHKNGLHDGLKSKLWFGTKSTYDHILVSKNNRIADYEYSGAEIIDPKLMISDHAPVFAKFYYL